MIDPLAHTVADPFSIHYDQLFVRIIEPTGERIFVDCGNNLDHCFKVIELEGQDAEPWTLFHLIGVRGDRATVLARWGKGRTGKLTRHRRV